MFPLKQKFKSVACSPIYDEVEERTENGMVITVRKVDQKPLPKPHLFDIEKMIESGVDLKQMNTKILNPNLAPIADALDEPWNNDNNNKEEVNNEN